MRRLATAVCVLFVACVAAQALAAAEKADPTGTWKWTVSYGKQSRETTLKLKLEGFKLTGVILARENQEIKIEDAKFNRSTGELSFKVTRARGEQKFVMKYTGKLEGDTIKGKVEYSLTGSAGGKAPPARDWEAKRVPNP